MRKMGFQIMNKSSMKSSRDIKENILATRHFPRNPLTLYAFRLWRKEPVLAKFNPHPDAIPPTSTDSRKSDVFVPP